MAIFECGACRKTFESRDLEPALSYSCPECQTPLHTVDSTAPADVAPASWPEEAREAFADPGRRFGRFVLARSLGVGGMGKVFKAWDPPLGRWVAIKVLRPGAADPEGLERFRREASVVASLDHPNIAPVYDVVEVDGRSAIVMKYIEGRTLEDLYRDFPGGTSPMELVVRLIRDVGLGLGYAHGRGFVHRDLKPGNLMVDRDSRVYILDFGLAKILARSGALTDLGRIMGTPAFMSPEQAMGLARDVNPRSDVFSLGATLWALLAGQRPFQGRGNLDVARAILRDPTPTVRRVRPNVPESLDRVLRKAMQRERALRFPTGVEMATALNECLLELESSGESGRRATSARPSDARGVVLMIEDEAGIVAFVQAALAHEPLDIVHYDDGSAALDASTGLNPAVVLLDVNLPGLTGWEILQRLRRNPSYEQVPIIMVTGQGTEEDVVRGFQLGADDYIVKPFSPTVFRARVRRQLARRAGPSDHLSP